LQDNSGVEKF
jgi:hypothetical protein